MSKVSPVSKIEYKSMDPRTHVLNRPDMYIGSIRNTNTETYVCLEDYKIVKKNIKNNPGIIRIFIEALSNAIDNVWRSSSSSTPCTKIKVTINPETGETSVWNDGIAIPVEIHKEHQIYTPELIFGRLLTSSNYNDQEDRKTSGKNGVGIKACGIFSTQFTVKVCDNVNNKSYVQKWTDNMASKKEPVVKDLVTPKNGHTHVIWTPDFSRFTLTGYTEDILSLMYKHVLDTAMITGIPVYLNGSKVPVTSFKDYAQLYFETKEILHIKTVECDVVLTPTNLQDWDCISFVNGIETPLGGIHVDLWSETIFRPILDKINGKKAGAPQLNIRDVKQFFRLFINTTVTRPEFSSQEKSRLVSPTVKTEFTQKHLNALMKWSVIDKIKDIIKSKELLSLKKIEKKKGFKKIEGFDPANNAGSNYSTDCTLIICEGLSAKTFAVMGIEVGFNEKKGRDWFGIYPLRGKILNVRNASTSSVSKNREVTDIIQALGIRFGVDYTDDKNYESLNYGKVMLLCDSDSDGLHISGLIINLFHSMFPSVLKRPDAFIVNMKTPLVRLYLKNSELSFYSNQEYKKYYVDNPDTAGRGRIKYFKGLGTSSDKEIRSSFGKKVVNYAMDQEADDNMKKAFDTKFSDARKKWLEEYDPAQIFDEQDNVMAISDFIDNDLIKFSIEDCKRSIPSLMDGLKESHRKILYAAFLKNLKYSGKTMKVAQLAGFVAEKTNYHHGEQCLFDTITKLAHDFVGSNNIPLLFRDGQFGSRISLGKDAASARYIFTKLEMLTRYIFREEDDELLDYIIDEGEKVEPVQYIPIIPLILVNGCTGIGTGWSCNIPCYNPEVLVEAVKSWITRRENPEINISWPDMKPWYRGFKGTVEECEGNDSKNSSGGKAPKRSPSGSGGEAPKYNTWGILQKSVNKTTVTELPIGMSTDKFKDSVEDLLEEKRLKSYKNYSTTEDINFVLTEHKDGINCNLENLKLKSSITTTNMVLFSNGQTIKKYDTVYDILEEFCGVRYSYYVKRKKHIVDNLDKQLKFVNNKWRFINDVMEEKIIINKRDEQDIVSDLEKMGYDKFDGEGVMGYRYLLDMKIRSFTQQKLDELALSIKNLETQLVDIKEKSEAEMWKIDLNEFSAQYKKWLKK